MRILVYRGDGRIEQWLDELGQALPQAAIVGWKDGEPRPAACDYAVIWAPSPALLEQLARVKAVFLMGAGVDAILKHGDALPAAPIIRVGDAGMADQMAEYVLYGVLRYFRQMPQYEAFEREHSWRPLPHPDRDSFTVGVMGTGKLGMRVVGALRHFGFPVRIWSRSAREVAGVECFAGKDQLDEFLRGTRALACLLPLTPETTGLFDRERLSRLPQGAFIINVSRGAIFVEDDLLSLVREDHIAGALLDVFEEEPLDAGHPFWDEPRVTVTPHISGRTIVRETVRQIVRKIAALEQGQPVDDVVDRNRGY
ncbi:glyoxylate/hydroxypyruvate reductase A [Massilia terrae]|uniref:Glyoxylate/hydroxypyruvate reductase A n=2 Tax=Massilia terrae TaxID=1811224 RepID=A0ABT2D0U4_9BURK|nr:glyoxylate/hydroxypyruvate reductase A [Massilia terrae]